ncbi:hypothetical protein ACP4OV_009849 [Aristida adscensionis]
MPAARVVRQLQPSRFRRCCDMLRRRPCALRRLHHRRPPPAQGHPICKSTYHVVRVSDIARLLDVSLVQAYMSNGDSVVFLNTRPVSDQGKPSTARYDMCEYGIQQGNYYTTAVVVPGCRIRTSGTWRRRACHGR